MKTLKEIKDILRESKPLLKEKYRVRGLGIFGSYVRHEDKKKNDVDILVEFREPVSLLGLVRLENYLSDLLGVKTDVVPQKDLRSELKEKIYKETVYL